jgi:hypothetical protein
MQRFFLDAKKQRLIIKLMGISARVTGLMISNRPILPASI